jgi:two-component system sensor histidine kinase EvgS
VVELVHDLRSPLASILNLSEMLMRSRSDVGDLERYWLALVNGSARELTALLSDAIELAHEGSGLLEWEPDGPGIGEILESVATVVRPLAEMKGLDVRTHCSALDRPVAHRPALRRVLLNLTTNAVKFTDEGYVEMVAAPRLDDRLSISVRDSGGGLSPAVSEALARPLGESSVGNTASSMSNLGLTICRKLLATMGTELEFETQPGQGTRFHFALDLPTATP